MSSCRVVEETRRVLGNNYYKITVSAFLGLQPFFPSTNHALDEPYQCFMESNAVGAHKVPPLSICFPVILADRYFLCKDHP